MIKFNDVLFVIRFFFNILVIVCLVKLFFVGFKLFVKIMVLNLDRYCFIIYFNFWGLLLIIVCFIIFLLILLKSFERYCLFVLVIWFSNNLELIVIIEIFINDIFFDIYIVFLIILLYIFL